MMTKIGIILLSPGLLRDTKVKLHIFIVSINGVFIGSSSLKLVDM